MTTSTPTLRGRLGGELFARVAGPRGPQVRDRIHGTPGERWFGPDDAIRRVHGDASMFVGGLTALLLQSWHPLAMAAVAAHSGYRGDPWGRLQRTSTFLAVTTFGTVEHAQQAIGMVRRIHDGIVGTTADGEPYAASDPHLLRWVHVTEAHAFLTAHQRYGARPLDAAGCDDYVAQGARVGRALGATDLPETAAGLRDALDAYRPELRGTPEAREAARFLLVHPPLPVAARVPYGVLAAAAVAGLPRASRGPLGLPDVPWLDATVSRAAGHGMTRLIRWALATQPPPPTPEP
ncbi:oxygenase MpaB family protein [Cellulomonas sp. NPDC058312]|uniref:oxygenase MpaB family protein n=1 Tax=Cellulomonas sp. NPDC058312 TaxID=3346441 RepID=UPI0036E0054A